MALKTMAMRFRLDGERDMNCSSQPARSSAGLRGVLLRGLLARAVAACSKNSPNVRTIDTKMWKRFLIVFSVVSGIVVLSVWSFFQYHRSFHLSQIVTREGQATQAVIDRIRRDLVRPVGDTLILADAADTRAYLIDGQEHLRDHLTAEFESLAIHTQIYDQIRLIDDAGLERIRVNYRDGRSEHVPVEHLQDKSGRYYFEDTLHLTSHEVFISPLDLNVEHGQVEVPHRPMIRFGAPVLDVEGRAWGVVLLNYQAQVILDNAVSAMTGVGELMILNADGYWLLAPDPHDAWGFMLDHGDRFADRYPAIWQTMVQMRSGSTSNEEGLFVFESVVLLDEATQYAALAHGPVAESAAQADGDNRDWMIVSHLHGDFLEDAGVMTIADAVTLGALLVVGAGMVQAGFIWLTASRRQAERETRLVHQRLVDAIEIHPGALGIFDRTDRLALCNVGYLEVRGISQQMSEKGPTYEAVLRAGLAEGRYPAAVGREDAWLADRLADHGEPEGQLEQPTKDGSWYLVRERRTRHGETVDEHTDITKLKLREDQLVAANRQIEQQARDLHDARNRAVTARQHAEEANRAKSLFLASMSHELRTPLNSILGFSEVIDSEFLGEINIKKYREYAGDIRSSGRHLLALINQILDLSKIEAGKTQITPEFLDVDALVDQAIRMIDVEVNRRSLVVDRAIEQPSPALFADREGVVRILQNLLSNALKFTPPGGRIEVAVQRLDDGRTCLAVADSGDGMPADQIQRLVQPFEQLDNHFGHASEGTGLGLAMVNSIMALHRGSMEIRSVVGRGTTVRVIFPRPDGHVSPELGIGENGSV